MHYVLSSLRPAFTDKLALTHSVSEVSQKILNLIGLDIGGSGHRLVQLDQVDITAVIVANLGRVIGIRKVHCLRTLGLNSQDQALGVTKSALIRQKLCVLQTCGARHDNIICHIMHHCWLR